jgi:hypothetical protein
MPHWHAAYVTFPVNVHEKFVFNDKRRAVVGEATTA